MKRVAVATTTTIMAADTGPGPERGRRRGGYMPLAHTLPHITITTIATTITRNTGSRRMVAAGDTIWNENTQKSVGADMVAGGMNMTIKAGRKAGTLISLTLQWEEMTGPHPPPVLGVVVIAMVTAGMKKKKSMATDSTTTSILLPLTTPVRRGGGRERGVAMEEERAATDNMAAGTVLVQEGVRQRE